MRRGEPVDIEIANLLRELRQEAGLTQPTVAFRAGVSVNTISALELGTRSTRAVGVAVAYRLAQALGVDPARLLLAMGSGDPQAKQESGPSLDITSAPVATLPVEHDFSWTPWGAASLEVRYAVPRSITSANPGGVVVRWPAGAAAPLVTVAARSYLGRMAPGWVGYLPPTQVMLGRRDDSDDAEPLDIATQMANVGLVMVSWPNALALVTLSELEQDMRYESGFDIEGGHIPHPDERRVHGRITWWAPT